MHYLTILTTNLHMNTISRYVSQQREMATNRVQSILDYLNFFSQHFYHLNMHNVISNSIKLTSIIQTLDSPGPS